MNLPFLLLWMIGFANFYQTLQFEDEENEWMRPIYAICWPVVAMVNLMDKSET